MSTEKRLFLFLVLTFTVLAGYSVLVELYGPKRPPQKADQAQVDEQKAAANKQVAAEEKPAEEKPAEEKLADDAGKEKQPAPPDNDKPAVGAVDAKAPQPQTTHSHQVVTLGTYSPPLGSSPLLVTLNTRGGALERVELVGRKKNGDLRYRDLDHTEGYLGNLSLAIENEGGCRIQSVAAGTPASLAQSTDSEIPAGLQPNDILTAVNGQPINIPSDLDAALRTLKPKESIKLTVTRAVNGQQKTLTFTATLDVRPFQLIKPEPLEKGEVQPHPQSLLLSVRNAAAEKAEFLSRLRDVDWQLVVLNGPQQGVEFHYQIQAAAAKEFGLAGPVEVIKRYWLGTADANPAAGQEVENFQLPYHLDFEIELHNLSSQPQSLAYRLDGLNGLPTEGWWYLTKLHPQWFTSAGARDVAIGREIHQLIGASTLFNRMKKDEKNPHEILFTSTDPINKRMVRYIGIDTQYFSAILIPAETSEKTSAEFSQAEAFVLNDVQKKPKGWERTSNTTFQLVSMQRSVGPDERYVQRFQLFAGPKAPEVLAKYKLGNLIYYGWPIFGYVAQFLGGILHFFYAIVGNYGIAIIMLTVLVRSCMFPISRTAARNAAMMQELAPEMRKIAEKHKNNLEARGKAQQELFRAHNYHPLSGCWLMFLQLPVFIGLYRCLAIDIELRQAPLIRGFEWCSNLAGPDKLFFWKHDFFAYFTDESGWLGPYFNLLPIFTIGLFLLHQKLFTPPATDEQSEMQLKMMKFMTIFMGILFYKVPAGLCLYFITSSLWGIAERKLLPKPTPKKKDDTIISGANRDGGKGGDGGFLANLLKPKTPPPGGNGSDRKKELERKLRKK